MSNPTKCKILCPFCSAPWSDANIIAYNFDASDQCESGRFDPENCSVQITCHKCGKLMYQKDGIYDNRYD